MTQSIYDKWSSALGSATASDWHSQYSDYFNSQDFPSLLPIATRVAAQTIGQNLVSVQPMDSINYDEIDRIKAEVKAENRERKIDSLIENQDFKEMTIEEHPDYKKSGPTGHLFYLDFKYESGTNSLYLGNCLP